MNRRLSIAAATATLAASSLLAACGGTTATQPSASTSAPATQAAPSTTTGPAATPSSSTPASTPSPSSTATFDKAKESKAAAEASEKFANAVFTLGYPDPSTDAYFKRMRPLTTDRAYVEVKEGAAKSDFSKLGKQLAAKRARSASGVKGDVTVVTIDAASAKTSFQLQVKFQQRSGDGWKTSRTAPAEAEKLELVKQGGTWLVDHLPEG